MKITRFQMIIEDKNHTFSKDSIDEERKAAFRSLGFDPDAPGASVFVMTSDIHADRFHQHLAEHVAFWNSMNPKPAFVCALGDFAKWSFTLKGRGK